MKVTLVHYVRRVGEGEYIALLEEGESQEDYQEPGYAVFGVFQLEPLDSRGRDNLNSLPVNRTFVEG